MPLIQSHLRRSSTTSNPASPGTPPPRVPNSPARSLKTKNDNEAADDSLSSEEVYK